MIGVWLIPEHYQNATDLAVAFVIFTMALYVFIDREIKLNNYYLNKVICFLAKHSFMVYLLHWNIIRNITPRFVNTEIAAIHFFESIIITLIISLVIGAFLDICIINPLQNRLKRVFLSKN